MAQGHRFTKRTESLPTSFPNALLFGNGQLNPEENPNYLVYKKSSVNNNHQSELTLAYSLRDTPDSLRDPPEVKASKLDPDRYKMEAIVERMQDETTGVSVRTVKSFMSKVPSVFTGQDLTLWMMKNLDVDDQDLQLLIGGNFHLGLGTSTRKRDSKVIISAEALHLAHLMAAHGYFFPIDDHVLTVKNDNTYYRFQTPCFWPSRCGEPENTDYAVYLCKRTMQNKQRLELADYEAENLARLQKMFSRKWEFIFMQAEAQAKVDKKRDKLERKVLDSQERAFWDVHRPVPGCVNTTEVDIKKACRMNRHSKFTKPNYAVPGGRISPSVSEADLHHPTESVQREIDLLRKKLEKRRVKVSKVTECFIAYSDQYAESDAFISLPDPSNPWVTDSTEFWEPDKTLNPRDIPQRRVKRWAFSVEELIRDPAGKEQFSKFLDKEFSGENLKFWLACQELKGVAQSQIYEKVHAIFQEFLAPGAHNPVNVDSRITELVRKRVEENPNRYCFEEAQDHIFNLMKSDSYSRYLRSDMYKEFLSGTRKKTKSIISKLPSLNIGGP